MGKFEALTAEQVRAIEEEAIRKFSHKENDHPHVETLDNSPVIARFNSVFPFQLFPDELIVEEKRLIWIHRYGPGMCEVVTILPENINEIQASVGPLLGHIHISIPRHDIEIIMEKISRKDTLFIRDLIEGLMIAAKSNRKIEGKDANEKVKFLTNLAHISI